MRAAVVGLAWVVTWKLDERSPAFGVRQVLRTMVASSLMRVAKLWTGEPSSRRRRLILCKAASERMAGATGSRDFLAA